MFQINAEALPPLDYFAYLRRTINYKNRNWPAVYQKLKKAWMWWGMITRVQVKTGARVQARVTMYNEVDQ